MSETDPLDRLSRVANQSEQPTPEFSDRLLNDLLGDLTADAATTTVSSFDHTTNDSTAEVIMLSPDRNQLPERRRTGLLVAASVAAIALIGGLVVVANRDEPAAPVDQPATTVEAPVSTVAPPVIEAAVSPLPSTGSEVEPGAYTTDLLGGPLTFEVPATLTLDIAGSNIVSMSDESSPDSPRTLSFRRISGWNTPDEAIDEQYAGPGSLDPLDIDAWADANGLDSAIPPCCRTGSFTGEPLERVPVSVGERVAAFPLEVRLDADETSRTFECEDGASCLWAVSLSERGTAARADTDLRLASGLVHQLWLITIEDEDPLLIHASSSESDETWVEVIKNEVTAGAFGLGPDARATTDGSNGTVSTIVAGSSGDVEPAQGLINPTSTFDGDTCTYSGPDEFNVGSEVTFTLVDNSATRSVGFSVWQVAEQTTADEILDEGIFRTNGEQIPESAPAVVTDTGIQVTYLLDRPGFYALNCADRPDGGIPADHATLFTVVG